MRLQQKQGQSAAAADALKKIKADQEDKATRKRMNEAMTSMVGSRNVKRKWELPPAIPRPATWNKRASCVIYIKREPGVEAPADTRPKEKARRALKSRISPEDLVCALEAWPAIAKSKTLFQHFAKRGGV